MRLTRRRCKVLATAWLVLPAVGCSDTVQLGTVSGTVTQGGKPCDSILVNFMPDPSMKQPAAMSSAITDDDGRYTLRYQGDGKPTGAAIGRHIVIVNDLAPENFRGSGAPPGSRVIPDWMDPAKSPFRFEVQPGDQTIDLKLD